MKLQLVWIPIRTCPNINKPHYDLCTKEEHPYSIACIVTDKEGAKLIRKLIQQKQRKSRKPKGLVYGKNS